MTHVVVVPSGVPPIAGDLVLVPGANLVTGERHFAKHFGGLTSLEIDVLTFASAVYCADLAIKRGERENIAREISLTVPVTNLAAFHNVRDQIVYALFRLSHDAWNIQFIQRAGTPEAVQAWPPADRKVLLFSGGSDSLAGAIHYGEQHEGVDLVSHVTANRVVSDAQEQLAEYIYAQFPHLFDRYLFRIGGTNRASLGISFPSDKEREESQRTRSFLFLALAVLVARRRGTHDVVVIAENGQMAIHLPLSAARIGAFSTQTAHPEFLQSVAELFTSLIQHPIQIDNPFLYSTKAEVIARSIAAHHSAFEASVSCWKASRIGGDKRHCGFCIPCLLRRIAVEANGTQIDEYQRDILAENVGAAAINDDGKRNLVELGEFIRTFQAGLSQAQLEDLYPDLVNRHFDRVRAVEMYRRFAVEAQTVFRRYPLVQQLLA